MRRDRHPDPRSDHVGPFHRTASLGVLGGPGRPVDRRQFDSRLVDGDLPGRLGLTETPVSGRPTPWGHRLMISISLSTRIPLRSLRVEGEIGYQDR